MFIDQIVLKCVFDSYFILKNKLNIWTKLKLSIKQFIIVRRHSMTVCESYYTIQF